MSSTEETPKREPWADALSGKNALRNCQQALGKTPKGLILDILLFFGRAPWKPNGAAGLLLTHAFSAVRGWGRIALCACALSTRQSSAPERQLTLCGAVRTTLARGGAPVRAVMRCSCIGAPALPVRHSRRGAPTSSTPCSRTEVPLRRALAPRCSHVPRLAPLSRALRPSLSGRSACRMCASLAWEPGRPRARHGALFAGRIPATLVVSTTPAQLELGRLQIPRCALFHSGASAPRRPCTSSRLLSSFPLVRLPLHLVARVLPAWVYLSASCPLLRRYLPPCLPFGCTGRAHAGKSQLVLGGCTNCGK